MQILVQEAAFDPGDQLASFTRETTGAGAIVSFTGVVRNDTGTLHHMMIEHFPGMTESALEKIAIAAKERFSLENLLVLHRFGTLSVDEPIMMVATAAKHRKDAFAGADYLMDYLKSRAPFWKKEVTSDGASWVESKHADEAALADWETS